VRQQEVFLLDNKIVLIFLKEIPKILLDQLKNGGRMTIPVGNELLVVDKVFY
jgi:protein-L-isoaspartate O-methyltransferase